MKIPLVGQSYALRSPAAACQQSLNLIPQFIDDQDESGKNRAILIGAPGYHLMGNLNTLGSLTGQVFRGMWSGGGRLFVVTDSAGGAPGGISTLWELAVGTYVGANPSTGSVTVVSKQALPGSVSDGKPAQIFGNGNQLMIVKNGVAYIDNGAGPYLIRLLISGTVNTVSVGDGTSTVAWVSGDRFPDSMTPAGSFPPAYITIDGVNYLVKTYTSEAALVLLEDAGNQTGALFQAPYGDVLTAATGAYLDSYFIVQRPKGQFRLSGTAWITATSTLVRYPGSGSYFGDLEPADTITFNGSPYTVDTVFSPEQITVTTALSGMTGLIASWSAYVGVDLGSQFNISYPGDGTSWDPLDFASKEGAPDYLQSILADHEQLFLFGTESLEVWQDTGNALFPLQRIPGAMSMEGGAARYAVTAIAEKVYYLSAVRGDPVAYRLDGFTPTRISTHAEEAAWASGIDTPSLAIAYGEVHDGHQFWVVNFPGSLNTWVYDETASAQGGAPTWHQRAYWSGAAFSPYVPRFHTFLQEWGANGMHVVGDFGSSNLYELNLAYFDQAGQAQRGIRILPHLYAGGLLQFFGRMTLEMDTGSTPSSSVQPAVNLSYSDDRGNTFSTPVAPMNGGSGVAGATSQRVFWPANGSSRDRVPALTIDNTGNSRIVLIDLELDIEVGVT